MHIDNNFLYNMSRLANERAFNSDFMHNVSKIPTLRGKSKPYKPTVTSQKFKTKNKMNFPFSNFGANKNFS
jgi:hypothetical protein